MNTLWTGVSLCIKLGTCKTDLLGMLSLYERVDHARIAPFGEACIQGNPVLQAQRCKSIQMTGGGLS